MQGARGHWAPRSSCRDTESRTETVTDRHAHTRGRPSVCKDSPPRRLRGAAPPRLGDPAPGCFLLLLRPPPEMSWRHRPPDPAAGVRGQGR